MRISLTPEQMLAGGALIALAYVALNAGKIAEKVAAGAGAAAQAVNPLNHDNIFAESVNAVGGTLVTDPAGPGKNADGSWSLGAWWYDVWNPSTAAARDAWNAPRAGMNSGGVTGSW